MITLRCVAVWALVSATAAAVVRWSLTSLRPDALGRVDTAVEAVAAVALVVCAVWVWIVCTVVVGDALRHRGAPARVRGVPRWAVRWVLAACGLAALGSLTTPAHGDVVAPRPEAPAETVDGLPFPDRATGPARARSSAATPTPTPTGAPRAVVVVAPGDSLWRISADRLGPDATTAEIAAATAALHELNRDAVGADPDLIHPGLRLRLPGSSRGDRP